MAQNTVNTINMNGNPATPALLAAMAQILDTFGEVHVIHAATLSNPGASAFELGRVFHAGIEALKAQEKNG